MRLLCVLPKTRNVDERLLRGTKCFTSHSTESLLQILKYRVLDIYTFISQIARSTTYTFIYYIKDPICELETNWEE